MTVVTVRCALCFLLIGVVTSFSDDTVLIQSRIQSTVSDRPLPATAIGSPEHCRESLLKEEPDESALDEDVAHFDFEDVDFGGWMDGAMAVAEEDAKTKVPQVRRFYDGEESHNFEVFYEVTSDADAGVIKTEQGETCQELYVILEDTTKKGVTLESTMTIYALDADGTGKLSITMNDLLIQTVNEFWEFMDAADADVVEMAAFCDGLERASVRLVDTTDKVEIQKAIDLAKEVDPDTGCGLGIDANFCIEMRIVSDNNCTDDSDSSASTLAPTPVSHCTASQLFSLAAYSSECDKDINIAALMKVAKEQRAEMAELETDSHLFSLAVEEGKRQQYEIGEYTATCEQTFDLKMSALEIDMEAWEETIFQEKGVDWQIKFQSKVTLETNTGLAVAVTASSELKWLETADQITCLGTFAAVALDSDQAKLPIADCMDEDGQVEEARTAVVTKFLSDTLNIPVIDGEIAVDYTDMPEEEKNRVIAQAQAEADKLIAELGRQAKEAKEEAKDAAKEVEDALANPIPERQLIKLQGNPDAHFVAKKDRKVIAPPTAFEREHLAKQRAELAKSTGLKAESGNPDVAEDIPEVEVQAPEEPEPRPVDFVPTAAELLESQQACVNQLTAEDCHSRTNCDWTNGCVEKSQ